MVFLEGGRGGQELEGKVGGGGGGRGWKGKGVEGEGWREREW